MPLVLPQSGLHKKSKYLSKTRCVGHSSFGLPFSADDVFIWRFSSGVGVFGRGSAISFTMESGDGVYRGVGDSGESLCNKLIYKDIRLIKPTCASGVFLSFVCVSAVSLITVNSGEGASFSIKSGDGEYRVGDSGESLCKNGHI